MYFFTVQFSHSVVSDSLRPHESQHARPPCPSPAPGVHWDSRVHRVSDAIQPSHPLSSPSHFKPGSSLVAQTVKRLPTMRETWFNPWMGKISWRRKWQPTPVLLPGKSHGLRNLVRLQSMGSQRVGHDWATSLTHSRASQVDSMIKNPPANARDPG